MMTLLLRAIGSHVSSLTVSLWFCMQGHSMRVRQDRRKCRNINSNCVCSKLFSIIVPKLYTN
jgi:hypothetical protein